MRRIDRLICLCLALFSVGCGLGSAKLRPADGALWPCDSGPHCVSSRDREAGHAIEPLRYEGSPAAAHARLLDVLAQAPDIEVVEVRDDYVYAQAVTRWMRFVDDMEFHFVPDARQIELRSSSRIGYYDFQVNRERLEHIRRRFAELP